MVKRNNKSPFPYQILLVDILIYAVVLLIAGFTFFTNMVPNRPLAFFLPYFLLIMIGMSAIIYIEVKHNHFACKKVFLILGAAIILTNLIAVSALPSSVALPNVPFPMVITATDRLYAILSSCLVALFPLIFFYLVPRHITSHKYLSIILKLYILFACIAIIVSLFKDFACYQRILTSYFSDFSLTPTSFFIHKNYFCATLLCAIIATIWLKSITKNSKWLFFIIPFFIFIVFTFAKAELMAAIILLVIYCLWHIVCWAKKSKDNLFITLLISAFIIFIGGIVIGLSINSTGGILFKIKEAFNEFLRGASATFESRLVIWDCTLRLLQSYQFIFGFGFALVGRAINLTYTYDPRLAEDPTPILHAHNSAIELIAEGGIVYLLVNIFLIAYVIYVAVKLFKKNKEMSLVSLLVIVLLLFLGLTDPIYPTGEGINYLFTGILIIPLFSEYYRYFDEKEQANRLDIINQAKDIKNKVFNSRFASLCQKRLLVDANWIKRDNDL